MEVEGVQRITTAPILLISVKVTFRNSEGVWFKTMIFNDKIALTEVTGTETKVLQVTRGLKNMMMLCVNKVFKVIQTCIILILSFKQLTKNLRKVKNLLISKGLMTRPKNLMMFKFKTLRTQSMFSL